MNGARLRHGVHPPTGTEGGIAALAGGSEYLRFVIENRRFLGFGLLAAALSGFGQTFFVSLFSEPIRATFDLGHGGFGLYYGIATLGSAAAVVWLGRALDRIDLRVFAAATVIGLAAGALLLGVAEHAAVLLLALLLLRLSGQGLMTHMAFSSMARYFDARRGRALGLAALGLPAAEAVLPASAVVLMAFLAWQQVWLLVAALLLFIGLPALLVLLRGHGTRRRRIERLADEQPAGAGWRRRDVLRDRRMWFYLPGVLAAPTAVTFLFFHQVHIADTRGWPLELMAASFLGFAAAHVVGLLFGGPWVDRITARRALPLALLPLLTGLTLAAVFTGPWVVPAYMLLAGLSAGVGAPAINALWAELYGIHNLGGIRALAHAAMSFATALSPPATGLLLDWGVPVGVER
ncbi:hypothetical protein CCR79_04605 [Halorhodospira halophila]|nr:hypothetical protein [Halorhodospira halophila]